VFAKPRRSRRRNEQEGENVGLVKVHLYRPFSAKLLSAAIPASVKKIAVLDRTKEPGSEGEPLYLDVVAAMAKEGRKFDCILGGRYGLSSKDTQPYCVKSSMTSSMRRSIGLASPLASKMM
jgi:pyruvate/2-oxoacid:ferredoxin oxidoreductase alpha subunit